MKWCEFRINSLETQLLGSRKWLVFFSKYYFKHNSNQTIILKWTYIYSVVLMTTGSSTIDLATLDDASLCEFTGLVVDLIDGEIDWFLSQAQWQSNALFGCDSFSYLGAQLARRCYDHNIRLSNVKWCIFIHPLDQNKTKTDTKCSINCMKSNQQSAEFERRVKEFLQSLDHRQQKCSCFTAARLGACHQITLGSDNRNGVLLDGRWHLIPRPFNVTQQEIVQAALLECGARFGRLVARVVGNFDRDFFVFGEIDASRDTSGEQFVFIDFSRNIELLRCLWNDWQIFQFHLNWFLIVYLKLKFSSSSSSLLNVNSYKFIFWRTKRKKELKYLHLPRCWIWRRHRHLLVLLLGTWSIHCARQNCSRHKSRSSHRVCRRDRAASHHLRHRRHVKTNFHRRLVHP